MKKKVSGVVQAYSKKAQDQIFKLGRQFFHEVGLDEYVDDIFACVDELIKNAVKANYKYILIISRLREQLRIDFPNATEIEIAERLKSVLRDREAYERFAIEVAEKENISDLVREILNEEAVQLKLKNRIYSEKREFSVDELQELDKLVQLQSIREEMLKNNIKVAVNMECDDEFLYVEVTNTAPILPHDLQRIYEKRDEYRSYRESGREYEFFLNHLDTSDSGFGLGYATIDSFLGNMGLDPDKSIQILAATDTTILLTICLKSIVAKQDNAS